MLGTLNMYNILMCNTIPIMMVINFCTVITMSGHRDLAILKWKQVNVNSMQCLI